MVKWLEAKTLARASGAIHLSVAFASQQEVVGLFIVFLMKYWNRLVFVHFL